MPDVDAVFARAVKAGATVTMPVADMFWGDRYGIVTDPFGHAWSIATHKKDMTVEQIQAALKNMGSPHCPDAAQMQFAATILHELPGALSEESKRAGVWPALFAWLNWEIRACG